MDYQSVLTVSARANPFVTIVEPWAEEFAVRPGDQCRIVASNPTGAPSFEVELHDSALIVYVLEGGSTYEFWRGSDREFHTPIAIPL